ncbi:MAG: D-glycero-beta-D-manno-heptose-7-phosphate kinase [Candidatus Mariimomonas ferrooxydans]
MRNLSKILKEFPNTGVLVIGDLMVDQYIWGKVERISPEAPVPVVEVTEENLLLGGAANVASNISSLGGRVFITGIIGRDEMGEVFMEKLRKRGINTDDIVVEKKRCTTVKTRIYAHDQQVVRFDKEIKSNISGSTMLQILKSVRNRLPDIKAIILSDYCKGVITKNLMKRVLELASSKVFIAVDPKIGHFDYYRGVSLITPNINEASFFSGIKITDDKTFKEAGRRLLRDLKSGAVLITMGDKGMTLFEKNGKTTPITTLAKEVYDVTGAGDTVIAAFTLCRSAGAELREAADFANHAAGIVVGELGTSVVTPEEIKESYRLNNPYGKARAKHSVQER